ncbi:MAG TPA: 4-hydroxythreonine-4-phosphate dehydrogenase PdxA [Chthoniobacterales bacterium]|nr:4-hydroxythreonine-4-phosphate dehydrogenase PdxA [Chthoniobacterales bacterium]
MRPRIGITLGDPAGIGPEIIHAALASGKLPDDADYEIIGATDGYSLGKPTPDSARAAKDALETAARRALAGEIDAVVTGPIHKARMYEIGFAFPGQTEFFAARCGVENFAMLLTGRGLTVALVTTHIPLRAVTENLRTDEIVRVGKLLATFLVRRGQSRIAVAGLNPHAGESGALGREEIEIIAPAIDQLQQQSISAVGPFSPDTIFHRAVAGEFDAVLCMYHDQGLIPLKLHAFHEGVNVTLGLPFPRTSPDHGTAFEIAGQGIARADSMVAAIRLAVELAKKTISQESMNTGNENG